MTTVAQAEAHLFRTAADASPFRTLITVHAQNGGNPEGKGQRYYRVELAVQYGTDLFIVKTLRSWSASRSEAVQEAKYYAQAEKMYFTPGLWTNWGNSDKSLYRFDI